MVTLENATALLVHWEAANWNRRAKRDGNSGNEDKLRQYVRTGKKQRRWVIVTKQIEDRKCALS
jgi:hypothetical protein